MSSASVRCCSVRATPICSTASSAARSPAVSRSRRGMPATLISSSMMSRVVPGTSVTMARSMPRRALRRLDLPTFGRPTMTVLTPSRRMRPVSAPTSRRRTAADAASISTARCSAEAAGISSSGKSIPASMCATAPRICVRMSVTAWENAPASRSRAACAARVLFAAISSMTPSARARSSRPWRKARFVNSPASAGRAPASHVLRSTSRRTTAPP